MRKQTALLVDDDASLRVLYREWLQNLGYRTEEARDGKEAWEVLMMGQLKPDVILSDYMMPRVNGLELLRLVRVNSGIISETPFILVSGSLSAHGGIYLDEVSREHHAGFLLKPFSCVELARKIQEVRVLV